MKVIETDLSWKKFVIIIKILDFLKYNRKKEVCKYSLAKFIKVSPYHPYYNQVFMWIEKNGCIKNVEKFGNVHVVEIDYEKLRQASHELEIPTIINEYAKKHCDRSMWRGE